jgi:hypothetical protein
MKNSPEKPRRYSHPWRRVGALALVSAGLFTMSSHSHKRAEHYNAINDNAAAKARYEAQHPHADSLKTDAIIADSASLVEGIAGAITGLEVVVSAVDLIAGHGRRKTELEMRNTHSSQHQQ